MSELSSKLKNEPPAAEAPATPPVLAELSPAAIASRRRWVRFGALITLLGGIVLSCIPGPKGTTQRITTEYQGNVKTQVVRISYRQPYGVPFAVVQTELDEHGSVRRIETDGTGAFGLLGNLATSMLVVVALSALARRRTS